MTSLAIVLFFVMVLAVLGVVVFIVAHTHDTKGLNDFAAVLIALGTWFKFWR